MGRFDISLWTLRNIVFEYHETRANGHCYLLTVIGCCVARGLVRLHELIEMTESQLGNSPTRYLIILVYATLRIWLLGKNGQTSADIEIMST